MSFLAEETAIVDPVGGFKVDNAIVRVHEFWIMFREYS